MTPMRRPAATEAMGTAAGVAWAFAMTWPLTTERARRRGDDAEVNVDTGLRAAEKLQAVLGKGDHSVEMAKVRVQVNWITEAVKSTVPQEMWGEILQKLDQLEQQHDALDVETEDFEDEDPYDPTEFAEDDDF